MQIIKNGKLILDDKIIEADLAIENGKICCVGECDCAKDAEVIDAAGKYVSPGFIDIHTHGAAGFDFALSKADEIAKAADYHMSHGTTTIYPTVTSSAKETILSALEQIKKCITLKLSKTNILGAHLEGPYFSKEMCGAQNTEFITEPIEKDYKEIVEKFGDVVKRWSYAPENDTTGAFCKYITENGILSSAGHSAAQLKDMRVAMDNGCKCVTHLYSATSTIIRELGFRKLGIIETAFLYDDLYVEIIADGKHLPPDLIKLIYKIKGADKVCMVTDSLAVAGTDDVTGEIGGTKFIKEDGVCKLLDRSAFAGSIATTDRLVRVCVQEVGMPITEAIKMMSKTPAEYLGLNKGQIKKGFDADLVIFDDNIDVKCVMVGGDVTYKAM